MSATESLVLLAFSWFVYFFLHSVLASLTLKQWVASRWPALFPGYRVCFNVLSVLLIVPVLYLMYSSKGGALWAWRGEWAYVANAIALLAVLGFMWSMKFYDGMDFLGLRQLKSAEKNVHGSEKLCLSPLHRFVRHPWYFFALVIIWTRDMDSAFLVSAVCMTIYFFAGSWLEERKLVLAHGEAYRRYMSYVPGVLPLPWRYLDEARRQEISEINAGKK